MNETPSDRDANVRSAVGAGAAGSDRARDVLGLVLVVLAVFGAAWVVMALRDPKPDQGGATGAAMALVQLVGPVALLFAASALAALGMGLWFRGVRGSLGRHLIGVLITTFTLSILSGTVSATLGGSIGSALGGAVTNRLTLFVSLPFGAACVAVGAWATWRRGGMAPTLPPRTARESLPVGARPGKAGSEAPDRSRSPESDGVTSAEAEALLPRVPAPPPRPGVVETLSPKPSAAAPSSSGAASWTAPAFPYPPDVRRQGRIPEGARPLGSPPGSQPPSFQDGRPSQGARDAAPLQHDPARAAEGPAAGRAGAVADHAAAGRAVGAPVGSDPRAPTLPAGPGPRTGPPGVVTQAAPPGARPGDPPLE